MHRLIAHVQLNDRDINFVNNDNKMHCKRITKIKKEILRLKFSPSWIRTYFILFSLAGFDNFLHRIVMFCWEDEMANILFRANKSFILLSFPLLIIIPERNSIEDE